MENEIQYEHLCWDKVSVIMFKLEWAVSEVGSETYIISVQGWGFEVNFVLGIYRIMKRLKFRLRLWKISVINRRSNLQTWLSKKKLKNVLCKIITHSIFEECPVYKACSLLFFSLTFIRNSQRRSFHKQLLNWPNRFY